MKNIAKAIVGGLTLVGLAAVSYRAYEVKKLKKEVNEAEIIEIEPEKGDDPQK